jgi:hypothetical protein
MLGLSIAGAIETAVIATAMAEASTSAAIGTVGQFSVCSGVTAAGPVQLRSDVIPKAAQFLNSAAGAGAQAGNTFRTARQQAKRWFDAQMGRSPYPADLPGRSCHEAGLCIDIGNWSGLTGDQHDQVIEAGRNAGFFQSDPRIDPIHFQYGKGTSYRSSIGSTQADVARNSIQACSF